jgi:hypothetical protein
MSMMQRLTLKERRHAILTIVEARFSVSAFDEIRRSNPGYWASARNEMARGIYGQAMHAKQQLLAATDTQLEAELLALRIAR